MALVVDAGIPFGNVCDVRVSVGEPGVEVAFSADPHGGPECLWFCFRLAPARSGAALPGQTQLALNNLQSLLGGWNGKNLRPVIRYAGGDWQRLPAGQVRELPDGRQQVIWTVDTPQLFADVALCYPYGPAEIESLQKETNGYWRADTIGVSQGARPLVRLSNDYGSKGGDRPGVYLLARQHSGETPGSWVLDGLLRYLATLGDKAPLVWAVPLSNIDGVEQGDYGKDNFPYDLNRAWGEVPMRQETRLMQQDMERWRQRCRPMLGLDLHAPGASEIDGIYLYLPNPQKLPQQHAQVQPWAEALQRALGSYAAANFAQVATYASRWETPTFTAYAGKRHGIAALSMETPYALCGQVVMTRQHYREAGQRIAQAISAAIAP